MRSSVVERRGRRWVKRRAFQLRNSCALLAKFRLGSPVFSGRVPLGVSVSTTQPARVVVTVTRVGARRVLRTFRGATRTGRSRRFVLRGGPLRGGTYRVRVVATRGRSRVVRTLYATRL